MKKMHGFVILSMLLLLASCTSTKTDQVTNPETTLETNSGTTMELTGSVVINTNHQLAGKTLNFEVEMVKITKSASGTTADIVEKGDSVEVHYVGKEEDTGKLFDSSRERGQTLPFTVGAQQMIAGFDAGVVGMKVGETKTLIIAPKDGYGEYDPENKQVVPKKELSSFVAAGYKLEVWEKLPTQYGEFEIIEVLAE
jgi:FKBP-type peptidyl-prolyl cis-trans isomerase 2